MYLRRRRAQGVGGKKQEQEGDRASIKKGTIYEKIKIAVSDLRHDSRHSSLSSIHKHNSVHKNLDRNMKFSIE